METTPIIMNNINHAVRTTSFVRIVATFIAFILFSLFSSRAFAFCTASEDNLNLEEGSPFQDVELTDEFSPSEALSDTYKSILEAAESGNLDTAAEIGAFAKTASADFAEATAGLELADLAPTLLESFSVVAGDAGAEAFVIGCIASIPHIRDTLRDTSSQLSIATASVSCIPVLGLVMEIIESKVRHQQVLDMTRENLAYEIQMYKQHGTFPDFIPDYHYVPINTIFNRIADKTKLAYDRLDTKAIEYNTELASRVFVPVAQHYQKRELQLADELAVFSSQVKAVSLRELDDALNTSLLYNYVNQIRALAKDQPHTGQFYNQNLRDCHVSQINQDNVSSCLKTILHRLSNRHVISDTMHKLAVPIAHYEQNTKLVGDAARVREAILKKELIEAFNTGAATAHLKSHFDQAKREAIKAINDIHQKSLALLGKVGETDALHRLGYFTSGPLKNKAINHDCWDDTAMARTSEGIGALPAPAIDGIPPFYKGRVYVCDPFFFVPQKDPFYPDQKKRLDGVYQAALANVSSRFAASSIKITMLSLENKLTASALRPFKRHRNKEHVRQEIQEILQDFLHTAVMHQPVRYYQVLGSMYDTELRHRKSTNDIAIKLIGDMYSAVGSVLHSWNIDGKQNRVYGNVGHGTKFTFSLLTEPEPIVPTTLNVLSSRPHLMTNLELRVIQDGEQHGDIYYGQKVPIASNAPGPFKTRDIKAVRIYATEGATALSTRGATGGHITALVFELKNGTERRSGTPVASEFKERISLEYCQPEHIDVTYDPTNNDMLSFYLATSCGVYPAVGGSGGDPYFLSMPSNATYATLSVYGISGSRIVGLELRAYDHSHHLVYRETAGTITGSVLKDLSLAGGSFFRQVSGVQVFYNTHAVVGLELHTGSYRRGSEHRVGKGSVGFGDDLVRYKYMCKIVGVFGTAGDSIDSIGFVTDTGCY